MSIVTFGEGERFILVNTDDISIGGAQRDGSVKLWMRRPDTTLTINKELVREFKEKLREAQDIQVNQAERVKEKARLLSGDVPAGANLT